jgi:hypothetical protein
LEPAAGAFGKAGNFYFLFTAIQLNYGKKNCVWESLRREN